MDSDVIDNRRQRLADRVRDFLAEGATTASFSVGYLFLEGLVPLRAEIERLEEVELLIGNVVNRLTQEQIFEEAEARGGLHRRGRPARAQEDVASTLREAYDRAATETALNLRRTVADLPRTGETGALLLTLARRIADGGLKVRLYTQGRIHAKLALIGYPAGLPRTQDIAVVGSSNLTLGGVAHPTEMNVVIRDEASVTDLRNWYRGLWDVSQDFHRELFVELGQSWAMRPEPSGESVALLG